MREFDSNFSLLSSYICDAVATKEEKKFRRSAAHHSSTSSMDAITFGGHQLDELTSGEGSSDSTGAAVVHFKCVLLQNYVCVLNISVVCIIF